MSHYNSTAIHCMQGLGANTIYCGDGINDIAALAAADVGMAIGATDAVVAASLSTSRKSIAGHPGRNMCLCMCCFKLPHGAH
jgi:P-type E1-E2 ATPase